MEFQTILREMAVNGKRVGERTWGKKSAAVGYRKERILLLQKPYVAEKRELDRGTVQ